MSANADITVHAADETARNIVNECNEKFGPMDRHIFVLLLWRDICLLDEAVSNALVHAQCSNKVPIRLCTGNKFH